ncbi:MAG TPA: right-handed parallel beta-helix repeat-containing protein, partial [Tepidisphaeraceae bacterium]|nr:right-handed parallel beta-helix repeat-containing protein [Tepidisphaeraceae bacterium]
MHSCLELLEPRRLLSSAIIYVDLNAPGPRHDGSSWQQAYVDLQDALAAARTGDQIRVADGTYSPGTNFGDRFQLKDGTATRGGYAGYGAANPDARDVNAFRTILTSNNYGNDIGVVSADGTGRGTILDGFTIKTVGWIQVGITNVGGAPTISNCTFTGGAGIDNSDGASPVISNCTFTDGEGAIPGAIGLFNASALITGCTFVRYHGVFGGALYSYRSSMIVRNCTFTRNTAAHEGQAVWLYESTATFQDCDFTRNGEATEAGGATLRNSILWGNCA